MENIISPGWLSTDIEMNDLFHSNEKLDVYLVDWPAKMVLMLKKTYN